MKIIGLTGGIGSGKTTVAKMFSQLGIPVYIADLEAKRLTNTSKVIRKKIISIFGQNAYNKEGLNRAFIADKVFNDKALLNKLNAIIHPKVKQHFNKWVKKQNAPFVIKEAAILFETGGDKDCDATILVIAPLPLRIERVLKRDPHETEQTLLKRINNQWPDEEKIAKATFCIENINKEKTVKKVRNIYKLLTK